MSAAQNAQQTRPDGMPVGRPFQHGNDAARSPGGQLNKVRELRALVALAHGPKVLTALQRLLEIGCDAWEPGKVRVAALSAFVQHVGSLTGMAAMAKAPEADDGDGDASKLADEEFWQRVFSAPAVRQVALKVLQGGKP